MSGSAELSPCGRYRYVLRREWLWPAAPKTAVFLMLNPSTADAERDDATIRKCVGFAKRWGMDGIAVVNLFGLRSRHPGDLALAADPVGPDNDRWIREVTADPFASVIAAWGAHGEPYSNRVRDVLTLVQRPMRALQITKRGQPAHPLMLPYSACPLPWEPSP